MEVQASLCLPETESIPICKYSKIVSKLIKNSQDWPKKMM